MSCQHIFIGVVLFMQVLVASRLRSVQMLSGFSGMLIITRYRVCGSNIKYSSLETYTADSGIFSFSGIGTGRYTLRISRKGYEDHKRR